MFDGIDYTSAKFWFEVARTGVAVGAWVYVWWVNRKKAMEKRFSLIERTMRATIEKFENRIDSRCNGNTSRITELETAKVSMVAQLEHMPKHSDIKELTSKISELNGRLSGINRAVDLINQFLINQGGKE